MSECEKQCEFKLVFHCAPSLCGIKCANLYSIAKKDFSPEYFSYFTHANNSLCQKNIKIKILCEKNNRYLVFVYNSVLLEKRLNEQNRREILINAGYPTNGTCEDYILHLSERICNSEIFPHETGVFLDYPPEDVKGFIENNGENFKFCGFWKVYSEVEKADHLFKSYEKCREWLCRKIRNGLNLSEALGLT